MNSILVSSSPIEFITFTLPYASYTYVASMLPSLLYILVISPNIFRSYLYSFDIPSLVYTNPSNLSRTYLYFIVLSSFCFRYLTAIFANVDDPLNRVIFFSLKRVQPSVKTVTLLQVYVK